jgi:hypothetical protein
MILIRICKPPKARYTVKINATRTRVNSKPPWLMEHPAEELRRPIFQTN